MVMDSRDMDIRLMAILWELLDHQLILDPINSRLKI